MLLIFLINTQSNCGDKTSNAAELPVSASLWFYRVGTATAVAAMAAAAAVEAVAFFLYS
ncbi:Hypothetical predicted protein [Scomber scombrus]|uniref:Uncharacterized protein n=1 Tax=Scomber scombrus TaxID=13677 RepID=A0AAV1P711_SCOSC